MTSRALTLRRDFWADPAATAAYAALMLDVFEIDVVARDRLCGRDSTCRPVAFFTADGACVASAETLILPLCLDGVLVEAAAVRTVAVAPRWRGQGLFRALMNDLLARCDDEARLVLLYAEHAGLYAPFGFRPLRQHKFVGPPPPHAPTSQATPRRLDPERDGDLTLLRRLLAERTPVSHAVAVAGGAALFLAHAGDYALDYSAALDAIIVWERDADTLTLVDVVAKHMPSLASLLAVLGESPRRVETLFPPDRLDWPGAAQADDTGLMIRGCEPAAFHRPFMLPPTAGF